MTNIVAHNQEILSQLLWAVEMAEAGTFTLLFAECDSLEWRSRLVAQFRDQSQLNVTEITLPAGSRNPYHQLRGELGDRVPEVLFVYGLETLHDPEGVLPAFNNARDLFARDFPFPIVFWLTQDVSTLQSRIAKDWDSWGRTLAFAVDVAERRDWLIDVCDRAYALGLATGAAPYHAVIRELAGDAGNFERAWQAVEGAAIDLTTEAQARIWLIRGLLLQNSEHQEKLKRYQQSLALWTQCELSETVKSHWALTLFYTGRWWLGAAKYNRMERDEAYTQTRQLWEQAIALWTEVNRLDLVARFINPLGEVYERLGAWDELAVLTARSRQLHETYPEPVWQAHDLGILAASVALHHEDWSTAQTLATQALECLQKDNLQNPANQWVQKFHQGWYWLNRAIAFWHQGRGEDAIADLEAAREHTPPKSDPYLYFRILETLRSYYFTQKQYVAAFRVKQHQQTVEFEFGFRAFVGAGRLQLQWQGREQSEAERRRLVTTEINASGREQNIQELVKRVKESRHRLTIIYGASGVGKSSLIRAALLPTLRQETVSTRSIVPVLQTVYTDWQSSLASCVAAAFDWLHFPTQHLFNESSPVAQTQTVEAALQQLRENKDNNLMTVLIFDQFEEFFLTHHGTQHHLPFYAFLREAMNIPAVKVILAMRSDYLHCLLPCNDLDLVGLDVVNHDILGRDRLHYLGKFSPQQAQAVVEQLTHQARFSFPPDLVAALIADLQGPAGQIRPIELQIVGAQLQSEQVGTLAAYQAGWNKERLVEKYLTDIVADCGPEQVVLAWNVLGLLIDPKREVRPIVARSRLVERLGADELQLDLVLAILHGSRLIFRHQLGEQDEAQFQLIHDYLVEPIREILERNKYVKSVFWVDKLGGELRTPLNGVIGFLRLVMDDMVNDDSERDEFIFEAHQSAINLLHTVNDLLDIMKMQTNKIELELRDTVFEEVLDDALLRLHPMVKSKGLGLTVENNSLFKEITVYSDHYRLLQVILSIVGNSIKFTHEGSIGIKIEVLKRCLYFRNRNFPGFIKIRISDTGIGVSKKRQGEIFKPFAESHDKTYGGIGCGLAISKKVIEMMG